MRQTHFAAAHVIDVHLVSVGPDGQFELALRLKLFGEELLQSVLVLLLVGRNWDLEV